MTRDPSIDESIRRIRFAYANGLISSTGAVAALADWHAALPGGTYWEAQGRRNWFMNNHTVNEIALPNVESEVAFIRGMEVNKNSQVTVGELANWCDALAESSLLHTGVQHAVIPHPTGSDAGKLLKRENPDAHELCKLVHAMIKRKCVNPSSPVAQMLEHLINNHNLTWAGHDRSDLRGAGHHQYQDDHRAGYGAGMLMHYNIPVPPHLPQPEDNRYIRPVFDTALMIALAVRQDPVYRLTTEVTALERGVFQGMWVGPDDLAWLSREGIQKHRNSGYEQFVRDEIASGNRCDCELCSRGVQDIALLEDSPTLVNVDESTSVPASGGGLIAAGDFEVAPFAPPAPSAASSSNDIAPPTPDCDKKMSATSMSTHLGDVGNARATRVSLPPQLYPFAPPAPSAASSSNGTAPPTPDDGVASGTLASTSGAGDVSSMSMPAVSDSQPTIRPNFGTYTQSTHNATVQHYLAARKIKKMHTRVNANGTVVIKNPADCTLEELQEQKEKCAEATRNGHEAKLKIECWDSHRNTDLSVLSQVLTGQLSADETNYSPVIQNIMEIVRTTKMLLSVDVDVPLEGVTSIEQIANLMKCAFSDMPIHPERMQSTDGHHVFAGNNLVLSYKGIEYVFDTAKKIGLASILSNTACRDGFAQLKRECTVIAILKGSSHMLFHKAERMIERGDVTDVVLPYKIDKRRKRIIIDVLEHPQFLAFLPIVFDKEKVSISSARGKRSADQMN